MEAISASPTPSGHRRHIIQHSMDWPLSKQEKSRCALKLYEYEISAADELLKDREDEVTELKKEIRVLRRLSFDYLKRARVQDEEDSLSDDSAEEKAQHHRMSVTSAASTAATQQLSEERKSSLASATAKADQLEQEPTSSVKAVDEAPKDSDQPQESTSSETKEASEIEVKKSPKKMRPRSRSPASTISGGKSSAEFQAALNGSISEEKLLSALFRYYHDRRRAEVPDGEPLQASPKLKQLASLHGQSEAAAAELWASIMHRHEQKPCQTVYWLGKSMVPPATKTQADRRHFWRQALLLPGDAPGGADETPTARLESYLEQRSRTEQVGDEALEALRREAESEVRAAWKGEDFMTKPGIADAVVSICLTVSSQRSRHVRGSAEVAALLLFAMLPNEGDSQDKNICKEALAVAEADAYWSLCALLTEVKGALADDAHHGGGAGGAAAAAATASRARRGQVLLRAHDSNLAELLVVNGLAAMPASRLGAAFCTRAGFSLENCARLWDALLADPQRFALCDFIVVALLMLHRSALLRVHGDAAGMAEALLATPASTDVETLLCTALAVRALERRRRGQTGGSGRQQGSSANRTQSHGPQTDRPAHAAVLGALGTGLGNLWGRVRARGAGVVESGRTAVRCAFPQAETAEQALLEFQQGPAEAQQSETAEGSAHEEEMQPIQRRPTNEVEQN